MDIDNLKQRWDYIMGGFTYLDMNHVVDEPDTCALAQGELSAFIQTLGGNDRLVLHLGLEGEPRPFGATPRSFEVMLKCDNDYLQTTPETPLDDQFGSVAMALVYRDIADLFHADHTVADAMLARISAVTTRKPIV